LSGRTTNKKCCVDKLVLGWFFVLGFAVSAGCVWRSVGKCGGVWESVQSENLKRAFEVLKQSDKSANQELNMDKSTNLLR
jgi:hypothetical protein